MCLRFSRRLFVGAGSNGFDERIQNLHPSLFEVVRVTRHKRQGVPVGDRGDLAEDVRIDQKTHHYGGRESSRARVEIANGAGQASNSFTSPRFAGCAKFRQNGVARFRLFRPTKHTKHTKNSEHNPLPFQFRTMAFVRIDQVFHVFRVFGVFRGQLLSVEGGVRLKSYAHADKKNRPHEGGRSAD